MINETSYNCTLHLGNMSIVETEMMKKSLIKILESFYCNDYEIEKIKSSEHEYFYEAKVTFSNIEKMKVQRFTESLVAFCLYWRISVSEY